MERLDVNSRRFETGGLTIRLCHVDDNFALNWLCGILPKGYTIWISGVRSDGPSIRVHMIHMFVVPGQAIWKAH